MSEPIQLAPMLAVYEDDGEFTVRVSDSPLAKSVSPQVIKAIGEATGARKLTLITPTDTKVFKFGKKESLNSAQEIRNPQRQQNSPAHEVEPPATRQIPDPSAPPSPEMAEYNREMAEAAAVARQMEQENGKAVDFKTPEAPVEKQTRKRTPRPAGTPTSCGRCSGAGTINGGGTCPVCRGTGQIAKWGTGKR